MTLSDVDSDETWQKHGQAAGGIASMKTMFGLESHDRDSYSASSACGFNTIMFNGCAVLLVILSTVSG